MGDDMDSTESAVFELQMLGGECAVFDINQLLSLTHKPNHYLNDATGKSYFDVSVTIDGGVNIEGTVEAVELGRLLANYGANRGYLTDL